jgi:importin subunit alpha-1
LFASVGCIKPLCDLLEVKDAKVVIVALEGLENILRMGEQQKTGEVNDIATLIDEADGVNKIQALQYHANEGALRTALLVLDGCPWPHERACLLSFRQQTFT